MNIMIRSMWMTWRMVEKLTEFWNDEQEAEELATP